MNIKLPKQVEERLVLYITNLLTTRTNTNAIQARLQQADKIISRAEKKAGEEIVPPIVSPQVDTFTAYLIKTFLASTSIFPVHSEVEGTSIAEAVNKSFELQSKDWQWSRNLILAFKDASKYDLCAVEACWARKGKKKPSAETIQLNNSFKLRRPTASVKEGFKIKHLNLYNTFWDNLVEPVDIPTDGEFAGYAEAYSNVGLHNFLLSLEDNSLYNHRLQEILDSPNVTNSIYKPTIRTDLVGTNGGSIDWVAQFREMFGTNLAVSNGIHTVETIYLRIVPKSVQGLEIPNKGTPQLLKVILVNRTYIVSLEQAGSAHEYIPIIFGQPYESNLGMQQNSLVEDLEPFQTMVSNLWNTEIKSNRRMLADRAIYNPLHLDKAHVENTAMSAKIPMRTTSTGQSIAESYYSIPYNDPAIGTRATLARSMAEFAAQVTGQNQVSTGQFVKGNKTNTQFQEVLNRADARQVSTAILLEAQFFSILKEILLNDFIQYQDTVSVLNKDTGVREDVPTTRLLDSDIQFKINDALSVAEDTLNPEVIIGILQSVQALAADPEVVKEISMSKLLKLLMINQGFKNTSDLRPTPPQQQQQALTQSVQQTGVPDPEAAYQQQLQAALGEQANAQVTDGTVQPGSPPTEPAVGNTPTSSPVGS